MAKKQTASAAPNIFASAKTVEAPAQPEKKSKKQKHQLELGTDLDQYAVLDATIKSLTSMKETLGTSMKTKMLNEFVALTAKLETRPDNLEGVSAKATASCELRIKGQPLTPEAVTELKELGVPVFEEVKSEQHEHFFFNPLIMEDQAVLAKISAALTSIPELVGIDIVLKQDRKREVEFKADEATFAGIAKLKDTAKISAAYQLAATLAIKSKPRNDADLARVLLEVAKAAKL